MQNFNPFSIFSSTDETRADDLIGTPDAPIERDALFSVPTGRNAQRSVSDRWKRFLAGDKKDEEAYFPVESRSQRRSLARSHSRQQRKDQARYFRRELAKENAARDLLNLFLLADGATKADPIMRNRAQDRIAARVKYLRDEQQAAYDKQIAARQKDRSLPAPSPIASHEEIRAQLWQIAQTAVLPTPKGQEPHLTKGQQMNLMAARTA